MLYTRSAVKTQSVCLSMGLCVDMFCLEEVYCVLLDEMVCKVEKRNTFCFVVCYAHLFEKLCVLSLNPEAGCHDGLFCCLHQSC
jgi:hypothetical protein